MKDSEKTKRFGSFQRRVAKGVVKYQVSYKTPLWAFQKWPDLDLPERIRYGKWVDSRDDPAANQWLEEAELKIHLSGKNGERDEWLPPQLVEERQRRETVTFAEYAQHWLDNRTTKKGEPINIRTRKQYEGKLKNYLLPTFGDKPITSITRADVDTWYEQFQSLRGGDIEDLRYKVYKLLASIMKSACEEEWGRDRKPLVDRSPCKRKMSRPETNHVPVRPDAEQFNRFKEELAKSSPWAAVVATICDVGGLREGEALGLVPADLDLEKLVIHVSHQAQYENGNIARCPTKTRETRDVHITASLAKTLESWIQANQIHDPQEPLFRAPRAGGFRSPNTYRKALAKARKNVCGLEGLWGHDLRKDALSSIGDHGGSVADIMGQGGHKSMAVAARYQVRSDDHIAQVMREVDETNSGTFPVVQKQDADTSHEVTNEPVHEASPPSENAEDTQELAAYSDMDLVQAYGLLDGEDRKSLLKALPLKRKLKVLKLYNDGKEG